MDTTDPQLVREPIESQADQPITMQQQMESQSDQPIGSHINQPMTFPPRQLMLKTDSCESFSSSSQSPLLAQGSLHHPQGGDDPPLEVSEPSESDIGSHTVPNLVMDLHKFSLMQQCTTPELPRGRRSLQRQKSLELLETGEERDHEDCPKSRICQSQTAPDLQLLQDTKDARTLLHQLPVPRYRSAGGSPLLLRQHHLSADDALSSCLVTSSCEELHPKLESLDSTESCMSLGVAASPESRAGQWKKLRPRFSSGYASDDGSMHLMSADSLEEDLLRRPFNYKKTLIKEYFSSQEGSRDEDDVDVKAQLVDPPTDTQNQASLSSPRQHLTAPPPVLHVTPPPPPDDLRSDTASEHRSVGLTRQSHSNPLPITHPTHPTHHLWQPLNRLNLLQSISAPPLYVADDTYRSRSLDSHCRQPQFAPFPADVRGLSPGRMASPLLTPSGCYTAAERPSRAQPAKPVFSPMGAPSFRMLRHQTPVTSQQQTSPKHSNSPQQSPGSQSGRSSQQHVCSVCKRAFSRSDMLTRHKRLHTGHKPYECLVCGQLFSRSDHLSTHSRTHTGEKPYKCPHCPYAACRRDMITRHIRVHLKRSSPAPVGQMPVGQLPAGIVAGSPGSIPTDMSVDALQMSYRELGISNRAAGSSTEPGGPRVGQSNSLPTTVARFTLSPQRSNPETERTLTSDVTSVQSRSMDESMSSRFMKQRRTDTENMDTS